MNLPSVLFTTKFRVNIVRTPSTSDMFIYGYHDFEPPSFDTMTEAVDFISKQKDYSYTITTIYTPTT